ncbi:MAG: hypothetical protein RIT45_1014 [Pseudomonadota bacterium]|jgi:recombination protein RecA
MTLSARRISMTPAASPRSAPRAADPERLQRALAALEQPRPAGDRLAAVIPLHGGAPTPELRLRSEPRFCHGELVGRLGQISGAGALSVAFGVVLDAQRAGEPTIWISCGDEPFYPPDVAESGIDLGAVLVVRVKGAADAARVGDRLLRSGAFGLLVLDLAADPRLGAAFAKGGEVVPMPLQARLCKLAQRHEAAVLVVGGERGGGRGGVPSSLSSLVSLRAIAQRERLAPRRYACTVQVVKDKRRGPRWQQREELRAPAGLR